MSDRKIKIEVYQDEAFHYFASRIKRGQQPPVDPERIIEVPKEFAERYFAASDAWTDVTRELEQLISDKRDRRK